MISNFEINKKTHVNISKNVKYYRMLLNVSQLELANAIGFSSQSSLAKLETNYQGRKFNIEHLFKIANYLNVSINNLINDQCVVFEE
jgi:transcriptional regulator with XRE-family HTH domain